VSTIALFSAEQPSLGPVLYTQLHDFLGTGVFNADGLFHEFSNHHSLMSSRGHVEVCNFVRESLTDKLIYEC
jgi:hypothetical protein